MKNYAGNMFKYDKLSTYKIKKILKHFCEDIAATKLANLLGLNRKTIDRYYFLFREKIMLFSIKETKALVVEFELDESYFGAKRIRGKRGRGAEGKTPVFGLLKRNGKVFVSIVKNYSKNELMLIVKGHIIDGSTNSYRWLEGI